MEYESLRVYTASDIREFLSVVFFIFIFTFIGSAAVLFHSVYYFSKITKKRIIII